MERLDEFLRTTIPNVDRFQCVERLMCSMATSQLTPSEPELPIGQFPGFDPNFQQGPILNPSTIQQSFSGLAQNPGLLQQGLQGLVQGQGLQGLVQGQGLQGLVQNPGLQQGLGQVLQQGLGQVFPSFQNPAFPTQPIQGVQGGSPFLGNGFQTSFPIFRENPDTTGRVSTPEVKSELPSVPQVVRRRRPLRRRPQRRGFFDFLGRLGRRKKRSVFDDMLSGLNARTFMGVLDQFMSPYSFYPFTHAFFMGMTGSPETCESLYASCPSTPEQMLDLFNNIHKHYPDGIPYKENLPWPLSTMLP